jgi:hypothetical protein
VNLVKMPRWQSHKELYADKIVVVNETGILLECGGVIPKSVLDEISKRKAPSVGDYFVQYDDGYVSWSPADQFEAGYVKVS